MSCFIYKTCSVRISKTYTLQVGSSLELRAFCIAWALLSHMQEPREASSLDKSSQMPSEGSLHSPSLLHPVRGSLDPH